MATITLKKPVTVEEELAAIRKTNLSTEELPKLDGYFKVIATFPSGKVETEYVIDNIFGSMPQSHATKEFLDGMFLNLLRSKFGQRVFVK